MLDILSTPLDELDIEQQHRLMDLHFMHFRMYPRFITDYRTDYFIPTEMLDATRKAIKAGQPVHPETAESLNQRYLNGNLSRKPGEKYR